MRALLIALVFLLLVAITGGIVIGLLWGIYEGYLFFFSQPG